MQQEERKIADWMKLPSVLQERFFKHAEEEATKCKLRLQERGKKLATLRPHLRVSKVPKDDSWKELCVAVIDGSNSPSTSERLGIRYGVCVAGYMIFKGKEQLEEGYVSDGFSQEQIGSQDVAQKILAMLRLKLEREVALECLEKKNVDLIIIDGSFFGFRAEAHMINDESLGILNYNSGKDLTIDIRDKTWRLLRSGKALGIIKRTRTSAIDGWLLRRYSDEEYCLLSNDKHIMSSILEPGEWFSYESLLGSPEAFNYFASMRNAYKFLAMQGKAKDIEAVYDAAKRRTQYSIKKNLDWGVPSPVLETSRYYIRCCSASPFEFEVRTGVDVSPILSYFINFHNPATGLPWSLDLIDSSVSLPRGFTKEFVEEIEAQLIRDRGIGDKSMLREYFSYLNPQKEED